MNKFIVVIIGLCAAAPTAQAADWYVDPSVGNNANWGGWGAPVHDFWRALQLVHPGDTVHLEPGSYQNLYLDPNFISGTPSAPVTILGEWGANGARPHVTNSGRSGATQWAVYGKNIHDVIVQNLDMSLNRGWTTSDPSSGIELVSVQRVTVRGNYIHDVGGNGITLYNSGSATITGNTVTNTAWDTRGGTFGSGISVVQSWNTDHTPSYYHIQITGNYVYNNTNTPRWPGAKCSQYGDVCNQFGSDPDGAGIILDRNDDTGYTGRILVQNNIVFGNGGEGIHVFRSSHARLFWNTAFLNDRDPYSSYYHAGEIGVIQSSDVDIENNIMMTDGAKPAKVANASWHTALELASCNPNAPVWATHNLVFSSDWNRAKQIYSTCGSAGQFSSNRFGDPRFVHPTTDVQYANFHISTGSAAYGVANQALNPGSDFYGTKRTSGHATAGAVQ